MAHFTSKAIFTPGVLETSKVRVAGFNASTIATTTSPCAPWYNGRPKTEDEVLVGKVIERLHANLIATEQVVRLRRALGATQTLESRRAGQVARLRVCDPSDRVEPKTGRAVLDAALG